MTVTIDQEAAAATVPELIEELLTMGTSEFYEIVDRDIRSKSTNHHRRDGDGPLPDEVSQALRTREVTERWFQALVRMKKSTEMTIAGKATDDKVNRGALKARQQHSKADEERLRYLRWRAGALRFLTGVEETLTEANYYRRVHFANSYPDTMAAERDRLSEAVRTLRQAIKTHRDAFPHDESEPSDQDNELWAVLDDDVQAIATAIAQMRERINVAS